MTFINQILPPLVSSFCLLKPTDLEKMWFKTIFVSVLVVACLLLSTCHEFHGEDRVGDVLGGYMESHLRADLMTTMTSENRDGHPYDPLLSCASMSEEIVSVDEYWDGMCGGFDNEAFKKTWKSACKSEGGVFEVPEGRIYRLKPITFSGPCKPNLTIRILGQIRASTDPSDYEDQPRKWIVFENLDNFTVEGGGTISGNGQKWWKKSCKVDKRQPCKGAPTAVTFDSCKNFVVSSLKIKNAQQMHVTFRDCENVEARYLQVTAPGDSPNTDGIHVTGTQNILISDAVIGTGDDCISIVGGSSHVEATNIVCGPGHGISIGSLGDNNREDRVSDVFVHGAKLTGTTNGVRIKTWQGGSGYAKNITFQDIEMNNVTNPIIIDQYYCDKVRPCPEQKSAVQVSNVTYQDIRGTSASKVAVKFDCSKTCPCKGIVLQDIDLRSPSGQNTEATCANVVLQDNGNVSPSCTWES